MIKQVSLLLQKANCNWCFLREPEIIEQDNQSGSDIDIWCELQSFPAVIKLLIEDYSWEIIGGWKIGTQKQQNITLRATHKEKHKPHIEIFFGALRWQHILYLSETEVCKSITTHNKLPYISGSGLLSVLATRVALRDKLSGDRQQRAITCYNSCSLEQRAQWRKNTEHLLGRQQTKQITSLLKGECFDLPEMRALLSATLKQLPLLPQVSSKAARAYWRQTVFSNSEPYCYLLGTDGSGKSSLAEKTARLLEEKNKSVMVSYWGRSRGNSPLVAAIRKLVFAALSFSGKQKSDSKEESNLENSDNTEKTQYRLAVTCGASIYLFEYWFKYFREVAQKTYRGTTCLLDRGPYDIIVVKGLFAPFKALAKFGPKAHGTIFCQAPAQAIFDRKPERTLEEIIFQQESYLNFCRKLSKNTPVFICDTTQAVSSNSIRAVRFIEILSLHCKGKIDKDLLLTICQSISSDNND